MSDISIPGVSSKYNTTKLVEDLVAAERIRLTRMEEQVEGFETTRDTWRDLNREMGTLQRSTKALYGFENPFAEKNAISSNERILTATASRTAPFDNYSITVKQVATADRFLSPSLSRDFRVQSGTYSFSVGGESVSLRYRGGTIADFARRLSDKGEGLLRATTVRDTPETQVLMIEAIPTGSANRLVFGDDAITFGVETGMMRPVRAGGAEVSLSSAVDTATSAGGTPVPENSFSLSDGVLRVQPSSSMRLPFDNPADVEEGMVLEYRYRTVDISEADLAPAVPPGPAFPDSPGVTYGGLTVKNSGSEFAVPPGEDWSPPEPVDDWDVFRLEGSQGNRELPAIEQSGEFRTVRVEAAGLPADVTALTVDNENTRRAVEIADIRLYNPDRQGNLEPANPVDTARDALIEFRGIEARRPTNAIDDLVDGLTINLKRASDEAVDLKIEPDTEAAKEGIIRFVFNYNSLLTRILVLTSDDPAVIDELEYLSDDDREAFEEQLGSLRGDLSLNQMKNRLQSIISNPYSTRAGSDLTLLAQIGVSTNASSGNTGGSLDFSKLRGYLEIDEERLDSVLQSDIDSVKDLFGRDTSGDLVIDSGVARSVDDYLTPYTQTGGFVSNRISRIDSQIDSTKDDISDYEDYLENYEADLKRQYGNMEGMLNQLESSSRELDNFTNQQSANR